MSVTDGQRAILRATLGLDAGTDPTRNVYLVEDDATVHRECKAMVAAGLLSPSARYKGGLTHYQATVAGIRAVWGRAAIYTPTGDEVTARETEKKIRILWTEPDKGRFRTGEVYQVNKSTVRWL